MWFKQDKIKSNLYYTRGIMPKHVTSGSAQFRGTAVLCRSGIMRYFRGIMPKHVTSGSAQFRGTAPELLSSEETSQRWRAIGFELC